MAFGAGVGVGSAFSNCQHEFKNENIFHGQIKPVSKYVSITQVTVHIVENRANLGDSESGAIVMTTSDYITGMSS